MILYILWGIVAIIAVVVAGGFAIQDKDHNGAAMSFAFIAGFGGIFSILVVLPISIFVGDDVDTDPDTFYLQAINMGDTTSGRFFLGSGYIGESNVYSFYVKSNGGFYASQVDADNTFIIEEAGEPRLETYRDCVKEWALPRWFDECNERYVIHVPPGSIKPMVNMDLPE